MNTQGECVLLQCVQRVQGSLEGEEELQREEYGNMQTDKLHTWTHACTCTYVHHMAHLRAASHKDKLG